MLRVGIIGISGYSGGAALELLLKHPNVRVTYASANNTEGNVEDIWPRLKGVTNLTCQKFNTKKAIDSCDCLFLAVPHTVAMTIAPNLLKAQKKVIDLSADYRLKKASDYEKWYNKKHSDPKNLKKAIYGLPELYREDIKKAQLIANPGCYPTAALLGLIPIVSVLKEIPSPIIIDAKSGISGAGRKADTAMLFGEVNENFKAYKVLKHQHTPEMEQYLSGMSQANLKIYFVPHLLPVTRGILATMYVLLKEPMSLSEIHKIYKNFYKTELFVRILDPEKQPELKNVLHTNYCDIGLAPSEQGHCLVITSVIDNLIKGAAGQAVQNMNLMCGFKESEGLR